MSNIPDPAGARQELRIVATDPFDPENLRLRSIICRNIRR